jgi:hypothetical protein
MKHLSLAIIFAALSATVFTSCRKGAQGDPGPAGLSGKPLPYKAGSITATLEGITQLNDSAFTLNLNYQYFKEISDNTVATIYGEGGEHDLYNITRYDSTGNSYIKLTLYVSYYDDEVLIDTENPSVRIGDASNSRTTAVEPHIDGAYITLVSNKQLESNKNFYFATNTEYYNPFNVSSIELYDGSENSSLDYENLVINPITGEISFDYTIHIYNNDNTTGSSATLTGNIKAAPFNVAYREGSSE